MMLRKMMLAFGIALLGACAKPKSTTVAVTDSLTTTPPVAPGGDTGLAAARPETVYVDRTRRAPPPPPRRPPPTGVPGAAPAPTSSPSPLPEAPRNTVLPAGTRITGTAIDSVHSHHNLVGDRMRIRVNDDIMANGRVVIPAGSVITLAVLAIDNAIERNHKGTLELGVREIAVDGASYPLRANVTTFRYEMMSRGVGAAEVAKTGAGAVVGGIIGNAIGGKVGTVVGAVGGAVGGAAIARKTADYDIVVHAGAPVTVELTDDFRKG